MTEVRARKIWSKAFFSVICILAGVATDSRSSKKSGENLSDILSKARWLQVTKKKVSMKQLQYVWRLFFPLSMLPSWDWKYNPRYKKWQTRIVTISDFITEKTTVTDLSQTQLNICDIIVCNNFYWNSPYMVTLVFAVATTEYAGHIQQ